MEQKVNSFLKSYSTIPYEVDRLIVSAFLEHHNISKTKNRLIDSYIIEEGETDYGYLRSFLPISNLTQFEDLIEIFEFVISPADKVVTGAVYTPEIIREYIINSCAAINEITNETTICDPACGCSGFLYNTAIKIKENTNSSYYEIFANNLFGLDIQDYSINRSKILLSLLAILNGEDEEEFCFNLFRGNALSFNWSDYIPGFVGFDIIVGNPPYVCSRNIDTESKKLLENWEVCSTGHPDLYIPFFELGIQYLKEEGILGYITMNTFFKSLNGRGLREYLQNNLMDITIIDFGNKKIFKSKSTYTCICLIQKHRSDYVNYCRISPMDLDKGDFTLKEIPYHSLNAHDGWNLNSFEIVNKIESTGIPLGEIYQSRNGIATLRNGVYIFEPIEEDDKYYFIRDGANSKIEKGICKDIVNPNKLTRVENISQLVKKIIFPYVNLKEGVKLINEEVFKNNYPKAYSYLLSHKDELAQREKGNGKYVNWYAYGRTQSIERIKNKLFYPHIAPHAPNFVLDSNEDLLFYNGIAIIHESIRELKLLSRIMSSRIFWYYITNTSKPYESKFYSLSRNYIKNFGIFPFSEEQVNIIINEPDIDRMNEYIEEIYGIRISEKL